MSEDVEVVEEDVVLVNGTFLVGEATAKISSEAIDDDDGDDGAWRYDDFRLTLQGYDDRIEPKTIELVFKSTDVETFAALLDAAATFYRRGTAGPRR